MLFVEEIARLERVLSGQFRQLSSIEAQIHDRLASQADGKTLKGNEVVGWLGEIYGKILFGGKLVSDQKEHDFVCPHGRTVSVKTRKGWKSGWKQSSAIPKIEGTDCPTDLMFVHLHDDYSIDRIWAYPWTELVNGGRFRSHVVRGQHRSYIFIVDERRDQEHVIYTGVANNFMQTERPEDVVARTQVLGDIIGGTKLERKLNSIGKQAFVENFSLFKKYASGGTTRHEAIEELVSSGVSNDAGAAIRLGNAKFIFDNGLALNALELVLKAKRIPHIIVIKANKLINELT